MCVLRFVSRYRYQFCYRFVWFVNLDPRNTSWMECTYMSSLSLLLSVPLSMFVNPYLHLLRSSTYCSPVHTLDLILAPSMLFICVYVCVCLLVGDRLFRFLFLFVLLTKPLFTIDTAFLKTTPWVSFTTLPLPHPHHQPIHTYTLRCAVFSSCVLRVLLLSFFFP